MSSPASPPSDPTPLRGRVCLVTGASAGIGRETARGLARLGAEVVMLCRSHERGEAARADVMRTTGSRGVHLVLCDLASQDEVRRVARLAAERWERLDVLVNNAAVFTWRRRLSPDGVELQLAVNHLAPFLLTRALLPLLRAADGARVVTVSSGAHRHAQPEWIGALASNEGRWSGLRAYAATKLGNVLFTRALARRAAGEGIVAHAAHPGVTATALLFGSWAPLRLLKPWLRTPGEGARTPLHAAASEEAGRSTGGYWADGREVEPSAAARDDAAAERVWRLSERLTGLEAWPPPDQKR